MKRLAFRALLASVLVLGSVARAPGQALRLDANGDPLPEGAVFRFGSARWRHGAGIYNSALSPDGKLLATADPFSIVIWDLDSGKRLHSLRCDRVAIFHAPSLTFSPDGTRLAHARGPSFTHVWDVKTGREIWRLETAANLQGPLCRFTPDGRRLIRSELERMVFWDLETGQAVHSIPMGLVSLLSPDQRTYVRLEHPALHDRGAVILGDARTGREEARLDVRPSINCLAFTPDGWALALVHAETEIQVRDVPGGRVRATFPLPEIAKRSAGRTPQDFPIGFTADGRTLLLGTSDGWIRRWDLATQTELSALKKHFHSLVSSHSPNFHSLPDGRTLVSTGPDGLIRRWDLQTGQELSQPEGYVGPTYAAYAPNGRFAAMGDGRGRLDLWDPTSGKLLRTIRRDGPAVMRVAFAPDGKTLAVALAPATVQLYDVPSCKESRVLQFDRKQEPPRVHALRFSPDGRLLCVCPYFSALHLWELSTGELRWRSDPAYAVAFSPDGLTLAIGFGPDLKMVDAATGRDRLKIRLDPDRAEKRLPHLVEAVTFLPDGRQLAVALWNGHILFLDATTGAELRRVLAAENLRHDPIFKGKRDGPHRVQTLAFSANGKWLVSGGTENFLRIWEVATATEMLRLNGHEGNGTDGVSEVAFSLDGRSIFSCGADAQAYVWSSRPKLAPGKDLDALWGSLGADSATGYQALWAMSEMKGIGDFLRQKIAPVKPVEQDRLTKLLADLNSPRFETREAATKALAELGEMAGPALMAALESQPPAEMKQRLRQLLEGLKGDVTTPQLRNLRAVQALELAGTPEARATLRAWAGGAAGARLTEDAKAALTRIEQRD